MPARRVSGLAVIRPIYASAMGRRSRGRRRTSSSGRGAGKSSGLCIYCGIRPATDREHVFARGLFRPVPNPPILVPACDECNKRRGDGGPRDMTLDEEYFRQTICSLDGSERNPVAAGLIDGAVKKCFDRSPKLASSILSTVKLQMVPNSVGVLAPAITWKPDWSRIDRVLTKIGKGLFYHFMGRRLPSDAVVEVMSRMDQQTFDLIAKIINDANHIGPIQMGNRTVIFAGGRNSADADETVWLLNFYDTYGAAVWTTSRRRWEQDHGKGLS